MPTSPNSSGISVMGPTPNPTSGEVEIQVSLRRSQQVNVWLIDSAGRCIACLFNAVLPAGSNTVYLNFPWSCRIRTAGGVYHMVVMSSEGRLVRRLILVR